MDRTDKIAAAAAYIKLAHTILSSFLLIVFLTDFKEALRMLAYRAGFRRLGADNQMTTVTALPHGDAALFKDCLGLYIVQQRAIALLMRLLNSSNAAELLRQIVEALFVSLTSHAVIHIGPLCVLTFCGVQKILCRVAHLAECLEPKLCVLLLVFGGLEE